jgi:hypothetical protein
MEDGESGGREGRGEEEEGEREREESDGGVWGEVE